MSYIDIVLDGPPGPDSWMFVEVENERGESVKIGEWVHRPDDYWVLRLSEHSSIAAYGASSDDDEALISESRLVLRRSDKQLGWSEMDLLLTKLTNALEAKTGVRVDMSSAVGVETQLHGSDVSKANELIAEARDARHMGIAGYTTSELFDMVDRPADALEVATRAPVQGEPSNRENCPGSGGHAGCGTYCMVCDLLTVEPNGDRVQAVAVELAILDLPDMHSIEDRVLARERWRRFQYDAERVLAALDGAPEVGGKS